jgi:hypothetical protein
MGFVFEVEAEGFAVEDIGPRHEEGGTCKVSRDAVVLRETAEVGKTALCIRDALARVTLGNDAETMTGRCDGDEVDRWRIRSLRCRSGRAL